MKKKNDTQKENYFICCSDNQKCTGDLILNVNDEGFLKAVKVGQKNNKSFFKVHSTYEQACNCTQNGI